MRTQGREVATSLEDGTDVLIRLFLDLEPVDPSLVEELLGGDALPLMVELGLVEREGSDRGAAATVLLYPVAGCWVVSDRVPLAASSGPGLGDGMAEDAVYPAITRSAELFLSRVPERPGNRFLELCSGTGIAALVAARDGASEVVAIDVTERSTHFARFNAALNGLPQVTALCGDLWQPVEGQQFDVIAAHPPYMAARRNQFIFRDGGADGEEVSSRIFREVARFLAPGGVLSCTCMLTEREGMRVADRVRAMLGEAGAGLDLLVIESARVDPAAHLAQRMLGGTDPVEVGEHLQALEELGVESMVLASVIVRRPVDPRPPLMASRLGRRGGGWAEVEWLLRLLPLIRGENGPQVMASSRARLSPGASLSIEYRAHPEGEPGWVPARGTLAVSHPFPQSGDVGLDVADFLGECDGTLTLEEQLNRLKERGVIPPHVPPAAFVGELRGLIEAGALEIDACPLPPPPPDSSGTGRGPLP